MKKKLFSIAIALAALSVNSQCWQKIHSGGSTSHGIKSDGTLWGWGYNESGMIGDGTTEASNIPKQVTAATDWQSVSLFGYHTLALKSDGSLWAWGYNSEGNLGDGTNTTSAAPIAISPGAIWMKAEPGYNHSIGIRMDGTLWAWGNNLNGQLGDGTNNSSSVPIQIGTDTAWRSVSAGFRTSFAIKADGTLWAWGYNENGELGNNNVGVDASVPTQVGTDSNWQSVDAGWLWSLGLKSDGTLWKWGSFSPGNPGILAVPLQVGTATDWASVTGGDDHYAGIKTDGTLWAAGENNNGQLGNGTTTDAPEPVQIGTDANWITVGAAGFLFTTGLKVDGTMFTWGDNLQGQLGDGTNIDHGVPVSIACPQLARMKLENDYFTVYPNPAVASVNVHMTNGDSIDKVTIYDISGKVVLQQHDVTTPIDVRVLQSGVYILTAFSGNLTHQQKLIVE